MPDSRRGRTRLILPCSGPQREINSVVCDSQFRQREDRHEPRIVVLQEHVRAIDLARVVQIVLQHGHDDVIRGDKASPVRLACDFQFAVVGQLIHTADEVVVRFTKLLRRGADRRSGAGVADSSEWSRSPP